MSAQGTFARIAGTDGRAALVTVLTGPLAGEHLLVTADGSTEGAIADPELQARAVAAAQDLLWAERSERRDDLFIDVTAPKPRLLIFGAVEYAGYLSQFARIAGWRPLRDRSPRPIRHPRTVSTRDRSRHSVAGPRCDRAVPGRSTRRRIIAVTHSRPEDRRRGAAGGACRPPCVHRRNGIETRAGRASRAAAQPRGERVEIERISAPIGLDLGGVESEEVAISIMAEMVAVRHGREGGRQWHR